MSLLTKLRIKKFARLEEAQRFTRDKNAPHGMKLKKRKVNLVVNQEVEFL